MTQIARIIVVPLLLLTEVSYVACSSETPRGKGQEQQVSKYEGQLVKRPGTSSLEENKVYLVRQGQKHWIESPTWVTKNGYRFEDMKVISAQELDAIPTGENIK